MKTATSEEVAGIGGSQPPAFFRLPRPGQTDRFFGWSRSFYFAAEKRGWLKLVRLCAPGRKRGITLIEYAAVEKFVRSQMEGAK
jgi:hypothetical protein